MKFVDEYRDPAAARVAVRRITELAAGGRHGLPYAFMEV